MYVFVGVTELFTNNIENIWGADDLNSIGILRKKLSIVCGIALENSVGNQLIL